MRITTKAIIALIAALNICMSSITYSATLGYTNGLNVWLDCDNIDGQTNATLNNGDAITNWLNKAGGVAGDALPAGTRCGVFAAGEGPLHDAVKLNGSSDAMVFNEFMTSDTVSIFAVARNTGGTGERKFFSDYGNSSQMISALDSSGSLACRDSGGHIISASTGIQPFNNVFSTWEAILSTTGGNYTAEVGEVGNTVTGSNANYNSTVWNGTYAPPTVGKLAGAGVHYFGGDICEILIYDHALSGADRATVEQYLKTKYSNDTLPYTTGLQVWLDSGDVDGHNNATLSNGDAITNWLNKAGSMAGNATPASGATKCGTFSKNTGPKKEHDAVKLNGSSDAMIFNEFMDSDTVSIFAVAKNTGGTGERKFFSDYGNSTQLFSALDGNGSFGCRDSGGHIISASTGSQPFDNTFATWEAILSKTGGNYTVEVGEVGNTVTGSNVSYNATTWTGTYAKPTIGKLAGAAVHYFGGEICEILIYDNALSGADRTAIENYLYNKYFSPRGSIITIK